jgi:hypothetical protein
MGRVKGLAFALIVALAAVGLEACGDVTENTPTTASASGGAGGARNDPKRGSKGGMKKRMDAAMGGAAGATAGSGGPAQTEAIDPASTCSICVRAENCCRAQGLSDCNYGSACADATPTERYQFYLVLCRSVLEASRAGGNVLPDVCSF